MADTIRQPDLVNDTTPPPPAEEDQAVSRVWTIPRKPVPRGWSIRRKQVSRAWTIPRKPVPCHMPPSSTPDSSFNVVSAPAPHPQSGSSEFERRYDQDSSSSHIPPSSALPIYSSTYTPEVVSAQVPHPHPVVAATEAGHEPTTETAPQEAVATAQDDTVTTPDVTSTNVDHEAASKIPTVQTFAIPTQTISFDKPPPNWRPWPFHPLFIISLALFHLLQLAIIIFVLFAPEEWDLLAMWPSDSETYWFVGQYLPVLVVIISGMGWYTVDVTARTMEPYYQMSRAGTLGAKGLDTLSMDYITSLVVLVPFKAFGAGHTLVGLTSSTLILVLTVLPVVQGGLWKFDYEPSSYWYGWEYHESYGGVFEKRPHMLYFAAGLHIIIILLSGIILAMVLRRKTGVYSDPRGIGGMAALISESPITPLLQRIDSRASQNWIDVLIQFYRFRLEHHWVVNGGDSQPREVYQIVPYFDETLTSPHWIKPEKWDWSRQEAHPVSLRGLADLAFQILFLLPFITLSLLIYHPPESMGVFKVKFLVSCLCVLSATFTEMRERDLRILQSFYVARPEPFNQGLAHWAPDFITFAPLSVFFMAVRRSQSALLAIFTVSALITSATVILWPPLMERAYLYSIGEASMSPSLEAIFLGRTFKVISIFFGIYQFLTWLTLLSVARKPIMPRKPTTISSVLVYLAHSPWLLNAAKGTSTMSMEERERRERQEKNFWNFGWLGKGGMNTQVGFGRKEDVDTKPWDFFVAMKGKMVPQMVDVKEELRRLGLGVGDRQALADGGL